MLELLKAFLGIGGGTLGAVSGAVKVIGAGAAAVAAYAWFQGHAQDVVYVVHVDDAAIIGGLFVAVVQLAHSARS